MGRSLQPREAALARKFLYVVAGLVVLVVAGLLAYRLFGTQLMRLALVPHAAFVELKPMPANAWDRREMWVARPDIAGNPALWTPPGYQDPVSKGNAAIFFIHPTSLLDRKGWNADLRDQTSNDRAALFVRGQASALNGAGDIWAPRYRQAAFGAFLTDQPEAKRALDAAYADVVKAWDAFLAQAGPTRPIIVAAHSQGSVHLVRLLRERIAGNPIARRIAAAYVIGWPVSVEADLPYLGLPACTASDQPGCILAWQSFAEPADYAEIARAFDATVTPEGRARRGTRMLCTNPLTGTPNAAAPAAASLGTIVPSASLETGELVAGRVPARCDARGILLIGPPPEGIGTYVLPGNNYHVFDYSLFWANVRRDAARRLAAFERL